MKGKTARQFGWAAQRASRAINYVWINAAKAKTKPGGPLCSLPLWYLDSALANAQKYPRADFNIWIDMRYLDVTSRFFINAYAYIKAPENLRIRDLNSIPAYRAERMFRPRAQHDIWSRVDLARLLVIDHCFTNPRVRDVYYADFDVGDVALHDRRIHHKLRTQGMAFGSTYVGIENSFMVFRRGPAQEYLTGPLVAATHAAALEGKNGFGALTRSLDAWAANRRLFNINKVYGVPGIAPASGYRMPRDPGYFHMGINGPV